MNKLEPQFIPSPFAVYGKHEASKGSWNSLAVAGNRIIGAGHGSTNTTSTHKPLEYDRAEEEWLTEKTGGYSLQSEMLSQARFYESARMRGFHFTDEDGNGGTRFVFRHMERQGNGLLYAVTRCGPDGHNRETEMVDGDTLDGAGHAGNDYVIVTAGQIYDDLYLSKDGGQTFVEWGDGSKIPAGAKVFQLGGQIFIAGKGAAIKKEGTGYKYFNYDDVMEFVINPSSLKKSTAKKIGTFGFYGGDIEVFNGKAYFVDPKGVYNIIPGKKPTLVFSMPSGFTAVEAYGSTLHPSRDGEYLYVVCDSKTHTRVYRMDREGKWNPYGEYAKPGSNCIAWGEGILVIGHTDDKIAVVECRHASQEAEPEPEPEVEPEPEPEPKPGGDVAISQPEPQPATGGPAPAPVVEAPKDEPAPPVFNETVVLQPGPAGMNMIPPKYRDDLSNRDFWPELIPAQAWSGPALRADAEDRQYTRIYDRSTAGVISVPLTLDAGAKYRLSAEFRTIGNAGDLGNPCGLRVADTTGIVARWDARVPKGEAWHPRSVDFVAKQGITKLSVTAYRGEVRGVKLEKL